MKIVVDPSICELHGECTIAAPELFELDDDDDTLEAVKVLDASPEGDELQEKARKAEHICPVGAISITD